MQVYLEANEIHTRAELHEALATQLNFPEWYGGNLDALWDCLTDLSEPTQITIHGLPQLEENLGSYAQVFLRVLCDAQEENENISLKISED